MADENSVAAAAWLPPRLVPVSTSGDVEAGGGDFNDLDSCDPFSVN